MTQKSKTDRQREIVTKWTDVVHEESNNGMIAHFVDMLSSSSEISRIILRSGDTNVIALLMIWYKGEIPNREYLHQ